MGNIMIIDKTRCSIVEFVICILSQFLRFCAEPFFLSLWQRLATSYTLEIHIVRTFLRRLQTDVLVCCHLISVFIWDINFKFCLLKTPEQ